jgi:AbrB family looped-hinge helix DNA binding protein
MRCIGGRVKSDVSIVTSKGLVTIPSKLRQKFGIFKGTRVAMIEEGTRIIFAAINPRVHPEATRFPQRRTFGA